MLSDLISILQNHTLQNEKILLYAKRTQNATSKFELKVNLHIIQEI